MAFDVLVTVAATLGALAAAWGSVQTAERRGRRLADSRRRRAQAAVEFETRTGRYALVGGLTRERV